MNVLDLVDTVRAVQEFRPERQRSMERTRLIENDDIQSLLERARSGDRSAFKAVISLYQRKVFLLAYSMLRNREDALDVVQETFMRLYQKFDAYERQKNFQGWLLQIAKNLCIDYYRKHNSRRREMESDKPVDEHNVAASDPESNPASSEVRQVFLRSLDKLGDRQRLVFVMKHYNGLEYREIAQVLRISVGTVKSFHFKAVRNLRQLMGPQLGVSI
jgi:RNA polymerase sigma-70 factor (ECF subfamily)